VLKSTDVYKSKGATPLVRKRLIQVLQYWTKFGDIYGCNIAGCGAGWDIRTARAKMVWGPHSF